MDSFMKYVLVILGIGLLYVLNSYLYNKAEHVKQEKMFSVVNNETKTVEKLKFTWEK